MWFYTLLPNPPFVSPPCFSEVSVYIPFDHRTNATCFAFHCSNTNSETFDSGSCSWSTTKNAPQPVLFSVLRVDFSFLLLGRCWVVWERKLWFSKLLPPCNSTLPQPCSSGHWISPMGKAWCFLLCGMILSAVAHLANISRAHGKHSQQPTSSCL